MEGELGRAARYIEESLDYAYTSQNLDGSWGRASGRDYAIAVGSTARMLQWMQLALPTPRLEDPQVARGIDFLVESLGSSHYQTYIPMLSGREISASMRAACVLNAYDRRVFVPADPPPEAEPAKTEKSEAKAAK